MDKLKKERTLTKRLLWFGGIWLASVLALAFVSLILRFILNSTV